MQHSQARELLDELQEQLNTVILGNSEAIKLSLVCLLARGHLLIEDIPGVGKTTLAHALAAVSGLDYKRVQFTSDLLPTDLLGVTIYDIESRKFHFKRGPVFTSVLLADEINRATPKSQSALLQAMEERQVSIEGKEFNLADPFFVIATQNPLEQSGTFPLPESQLDRFLMRISLGYPEKSHEKALLLSPTSRRATPQVISKTQLIELMDTADEISVNENLVEYVHTLMLKTRQSGAFINGLSPRAGLQWIQAAKALALFEGRELVLPDHIQAVAPFTAAHRLQCNDGSDSKDALKALIEETEVI